MQYWLVKQEPEAYAWDAFVKDGGAAWTGVRSFAARKHLRAMQKNDLVFYYHSGQEKQVVGLARVVNVAYPDPTAEEGEWSSVDLEPVKRMVSPVGLATIKADQALASIPLIKQGRLSVQPLTEPQFRRILKLGKTPEP